MSCIERASVLDPASHRLIVRRLEIHGPLSGDEQQLLSVELRPLAPHRTGAVFDQPGSRLFLGAGWAGRSCAWRGRHQIVGLVLPGDPFRIPAAGEAPAFRTVALTRGALIDASALTLRLEQSPGRYAGLRRALAEADRAELRRSSEHAVRLGAFSAEHAVADLLLELHGRLEPIGLAPRDRFDLPLAQDTLGLVVGISEVHANRVLRQLRSRGLLELGPGWAKLPDPAGLAEAIQAG